MQLSKYNPCFNCFWFRTIVRYRSGNKSIDLPHLLKAILFAGLHDRASWASASATRERPACPSQILKAKVCIKVRFYDLLSHWPPAQRSVPLSSEGLVNKKGEEEAFPGSLFAPHEAALAYAPVGHWLALGGAACREDPFTGWCRNLVRSIAQQSTCCWILDGGWRRGRTETNETCVNTFGLRPLEQSITRHFSFLKSLIAESWV